MQITTQSLFKKIYVQRTQIHTTDSLHKNTCHVNFLLDGPLENFFGEVFFFFFYLLLHDTLTSGFHFITQVPNEQVANIWLSETWSETKAQIILNKLFPTV